MIRIWDANGKQLYATYYNGEELTVSSLLSKCEINMAFPCAGRGKCGKCRIRGAGMLSPLTETERMHLTQSEIEQGIRLSCEARVCGDSADIYMLPWERIRVESGQVLTALSWDENKTGLGLAVDIGTTTVACCLWDFSTRKIRGVRTAKNPQHIFGADVVSRMDASMNGKGMQLQNLIIRCIAELTDDLCRETGHDAKQITEAVITGNTAMLYFLCGYDVEDIAFAPFEAKQLFGKTVLAKELGFEWYPDCTVYLPPCISAYVGADITCGILASDLAENELPAVLMDVGTNGEMVLCTRSQLWCCATAAGPAFEGVGIACGGAAASGAIDKAVVADGKIQTHVIGDAEATSICGSGLLDAVACLLKLDVVDKTGYMDTEEPHYVLQDQVFLCQKDIRALQLAKSAIRAGLETMLHTAGLEARQIARVCLAGGFGTKLPVDSAVEIGLLPTAFREITVALGNTALSGASLLLRSNTQREKLTQLGSGVKTVSLADSALFQMKFMDCMSFGEE